ncbi:hypothetical protein BV25DRAFT_1918182 [Artomyces pyxidatus]|uniref:Uncharacterized protein n=1 Tax=Artomyces pyxidatus TaxID=48021 RepID=A0ACB8SUA7_9AGAM|nr:hypothetical protein BV25DRAFT_1918182 [Artomyces pyxidatus]
MVSSPVDSNEDSFPENCTTRDYFEPALLQRLPKFLNFSDPERGVYSLGQIPPDLTWSEKAGPTRANVLCRPEGDKPLVIWIVGELARTWFYDKEGALQEKVNVTVTPLRPSDLDAGRELARTYSRPIQSHDDFVRMDGIYASRWQTEQERGRRGKTAMPFTRVFDATKKLSSKADMKKLHAEDLKNGDLVLMETILVRYFTAVEGRVTKDWNVRFELESICLLCRAPAQAAVDVNVDYSL